MTVYADLALRLEALLQGESDPIANLANAAALLWQEVDRLNWAGFYLLRQGELVLGPFQGKPACTRIPLDRGVCGAAARTGQTQRVEDVHAFPGHIACDSASNSELVIPLFSGGALVGVLDLDSPETGRFTPKDQAGLEACAQVIQSHLTRGSL